MSNEIDITLAAQDKGAEQALQRLQKENEKLAKQLEKLAEKSKKSSAESVKGLGKLNAELEKMGQKTVVASGKLEQMGQKSKRAADGSITGFGKLTHQLERLGERGHIAGERTSKGLGRASSLALSATQSVAGLATSYVSLAAAVGLAIKEMGRMAEIQENARLAALSPAQAILEAKLALENDSTLTKAGLEDAVLKIAAETRAPATTVANTIQMASSALGDMKNENLLDATRRALQIDPGKPEQAPVLASSMLDLAKFSGAKDMRVSAGFLQNIGAASHVKNFEQIGQNLIPAINSLTALGDTQERAGELVSTMTQLMNDSEGRISATASVQLGEQLKSFFLAPQTKGKFKGQLLGKDEEGEFVVPSDQFAKFRAASSPSERMEIMQQSPELRRAFEGQASFETKAKQFVSLMLSGDDKAKRAMAAAQSKVFGTQTPAEQALQAKRFESEIQGYKEGKWQPILTAEQGIKSVIETSRLADTRGQRFASARTAFTSFLDDTNMPGNDWLEKQGRLAGLWNANRTLPSDAAPEDPVIERLGGIRRMFERTPGREADAAKAAKVIEQLESQKASYPQTGLTGQTGGMAGAMAAARGGQSGRDPQMDEQTGLLREISSKLSQPQTSALAPRNTERPASRVSRGAN